MERADVVVVGGGPAGLAATDVLVNAGRDVLLVEARDRLGGRTFTDRSTEFGPLELGAELLHGRDISTWELVDPDVDVLTPVRVQALGGDDVDEGPDDVVPHDAPPPTADESVADYLQRIGWTDDRSLPGVELFSEDSEGPERWSALAAYDLGAFIEPPHDDGDDTLLGSGYDRVLERLARPGRTELGAVVHTVRQDATAAQVDWDGRVGPGSVTADAVVVTVPLGVLQADVIEFSPPLPTEVRRAIDALGMGDAVKLLYVFDEPVLDAGVSLAGANGAPSFWGSGPRGDGWLVVAWLTGEPARRIVAGGRDAAFDAGLEALRRTLGRPGLSPVATAMHDWSADPYARGAYSFVPPGAHDARAALQRPVGDRVFLAGEATDVYGAMTVHGAIDSGRRAAQAAMTVR